MGMDGRAGRLGWSLGISLAAMVLVGWALCASARAGQYHVYSCRTPDGEVAPVDGWSESVSQANDHTADTCSSGGGLVAALMAGHSHVADTDVATWAFNAPAGETLEEATLWRAGDTAGGTNQNAEASYMNWLAGVANSGNSAHPFDICEALDGCAGRGNLKNPLAANNRLEVPAGALHSPYFSLNASCGSLVASSVCPSGGGDENGYASVVELFAADLILDQENAPTVKEVSGSLAEASTVSGSSDVAFTAEDGGSGVYEVIFQVDGETIHRAVLDSNGGKCQDVGETTDGLPAFLYTQPCPASLSVDVPFDTTTVTDGSHHLLVSVTDAAGNSTPVVDRQVTVANHPTAPGGEDPGNGGSGSGNSGAQSGAGGQTPSSSPQDAAAEARAAAGQPASRGAANGSNASDQATLTANWKGGGVHLTSAYGKAHTLEGRLTAPDGAPIVGASLDLSDAPAYAGAHAAGLPSTHTDAEGRFTVRVPRSLTSGAVSLGYRSHVGDTMPVATRTLTLAVRVAAQLHVSPKVSAADHTIHFTGRLLGGSIPPDGKQLVLEGRSPGTRWFQFDVIRTSANGTFRASYRFRLPGPVPYSFRVVSKFEADYPFLAGASNVVGVLERGSG
jgi:hypothetical protein